MFHGWLSRRRIIVGGVVWAALGLAGVAWGQEAGLVSLPPSEPASGAVAAAEGGAETTEVIYQGTPKPGSRLVIGPDGPFPEGTSFYWEQVEGPSVELTEPTAAKIAFVVPDDARTLAFLLTVRGPQGERKSRVNIPIASSPAPAADADPAAPPDGATAPVEGQETLPPPGPQADAGDDQIGLVGRRITLNGGRSHPEGIGYRWLQLSGPAIEEPRQDGAYFSFLPTAPGIYRFALVVGYQNEVSEPDEVSVEVGLPPGAAAASPVARWAALAAASIPQGYETAARVAEVFDAIAQRAPLYSTYAELQSELTRRLQEAIPPDPTLQNVWANQIFGPLSQVTGAEMLAVGLDLRSPSALVQPLDAAQRERIQAFYQGLAGAFRSRLTNP